EVAGRGAHHELRQTLETDVEPPQQGQPRTREHQPLDAHHEQPDDREPDPAGHPEPDEHRQQPQAAPEEPAEARCALKTGGEVRGHDVPPSPSSSIVHSVSSKLTTSMT